MKRVKFFYVFVFIALFSYFIGAMSVAQKASECINSKQEMVEKYKKFFNILNSLLVKKKQGKSIAKFLKNKGCRSIAIYGMGSLGERVADELHDSEISICYGIDRRNVTADFPILKIEDNLPSVDAVIVTPILVFEEIERELKKKMSCPMYSIEDIIYFMD